MRRILTAVSASVAALCSAVAPPALGAQGGAIPSAPSMCRDAPCIVMFDWGSGKSSADYGPDRKYGSADEFENRVRSVLTAAGLRLSTNAGAGPITMFLRPTMRPKSMCDAMSGTNTDYSCTAMSDLQVTFASGNAGIKAPGSLRVGNRCGPDIYMTMATFGQYAAEMIIFTLEGAQTKMKKPSAHC
jgi:hypothetical protein